MIANRFARMGALALASTFLLTAIPQAAYATEISQEQALALQAAMEAASKAGVDTSSANLPENISEEASIEAPPEGTTESTENAEGGEGSASENEAASEESAETFEAELKANCAGIMAGEESPVVFYMEFETSPADEIILYHNDKEIGKLLDNGSDGDLVPGDNTYCFKSILFSEDANSTLSFKAKYKDKESNELVLQVFSDPTEEDYSEASKIERFMYDIAESYKSDDGYISEKLYPTLFADILEQLQPFLEDGTILYADYSLEMGMNVQMPSGLWVYYYPVPAPEVEEEPESPLAKTRWQKESVSDVNRSIEFIVSSDMQRIEVFYYTGENNEIKRPNVTFEAPNGSIYNSKTPIETEDFTFKVVDQIPVGEYDHVYYDVYYLAGKDIQGTWKMAIVIDSASTFLAVVPSAVPNDWRYLTADYKTKPLSNPLIWMDDSKGEQFIERIQYIIAEDPMAPGVNQIQETEPVEEKDYGWIVVLVTVIVVIIAAVVSAIIILKKKNSRAMKQKRRQKSIDTANKKYQEKKKKLDNDLESILAQDDYSDDDYSDDNFYSDDFVNNLPDKEKTLDDDSTPQDNVPKPTEEALHTEDTKAPANGQDAEADEETDLLMQMMKANEEGLEAVNNDPAQETPDTPDMGVASDTSVQKNTPPLFASFGEESTQDRGIRIGAPAFTDKPDDDYSDDAYEEAKKKVQEEMNNNLLNKKAQEEARIEREREAEEARRRAEEEAAKAIVKQKEYTPLTTFNEDMPAWMKGASEGQTPAPKPEQTASKPEQKQKSSVQKEQSSSVQKNDNNTAKTPTEVSDNGQSKKKPRHRSNQKEGQNKPPVSPVEPKDTPKPKEDTKPKENSPKKGTERPKTTIPTTVFF